MGASSADDQMDSNSGGKTSALTPFHPPQHHHHNNHHGHHRRQHHHHHHHHHFFYISPHCPFHRSMSQPKNHSSSCSFSTYYPYPQNPELVASIPPNSHSGFLANQPNDSFDYAQMMQDDIENVEVEEEEDPVFVLTDEWRDFFAKSEAKRRLAKQAKKRKN